MSVAVPGIELSLSLTVSVSDTVTWDTLTVTDTVSIRDVTVRRVGVRHSQHGFMSGSIAVNNDINESNYNNYAADHNSIRRKSA